MILQASNYNLVELDLLDQIHSTFGAIEVYTEVLPKESLPKRSAAEDDTSYRQRILGIVKKALLPA